MKSATASVLYNQVMAGLMLSTSVFMLVTAFIDPTVLIKKDTARIGVEGGREVVVALHDPSLADLLVSAIPEILNALVFFTLALLFFLQGRGSNLLVKPKSRNQAVRRVGIVSGLTFSTMMAYLASPTLQYLYFGESLGGRVSGSFSLSGFQVIQLAVIAMWSISDTRVQKDRADKLDAQMKDVV
ncbi:hypothetical protein QFZ75_008061 [Streptomyces sp. V3I8]|uniref:hypothetical protein n=1 Tax=Streptomyces sp. V3I8 TaxID=3042279 RepID=UPI0027881C0C|nr:hypothetical protein [Streptomyces sp. V3I8]MDQ1041559.1 hypothetical protein [Streptomyces sp. V3I8]